MTLDLKRPWIWEYEDEAFCIDCHSDTMHVFIGVDDNPPHIRACGICFHSEEGMQ